MNYTKIIVQLMLLMLTVSCKQKPTDNKTAAHINDTKQKESPYFLITDDDLLDLKTSNLKISIEDYHVENHYKYVTKTNSFSVVALYSCHDFGNCDVSLVTVDVSNKEISKIEVVYNTAPDGNVENYEYSDFILSKKLQLKIFKIKAKEDLETGKIVSRDTTTYSYIINRYGELVEE